MALQLFKYAAKAAAWSSSCQPSILVKASGSTCALRNFISSAAAGPPAAAIRHTAKLDDSKPAPICERDGNAAMRSLPGFGSDQFPVRIARRQIAGECPYVGDVGHLLGIAVDHVAVLVARRRHQLGVEAPGQLRGAPAQLGGGDLGVIDGDETALHCLAALLALGDGGLEAVTDFARQQILQRAAV